MLSTFLLLNFGLVVSADTSISSYPLLMPNVWPDKDELYLCTSLKFASNSSYNVVGFEPKASMDKVHHIIIFGCTERETDERHVWGCGPTGKSCRSGSQIMYSWSMDAPSFRLPEDTGLLVGKESTIKSLVLQVHYKKRFPEGTLDNSGVIVKYTTESLPRQAAIITLGTNGKLAPNSVVNMETACKIEEEKVIHPFAFAVHTHSLGKEVSGYKVRRELTGDVWQLIGQSDPQKPIIYHNTFTKDVIRRGEVLAARCTMNNTNSHVVSVGSTHKDEMCNFFLMYWVENDTPLEQKFCFSAGPPKYSWESEGFTNIPNTTTI